MGTYISHCLYRETNRLEDIEQRLAQHDEVIEHFLTTHNCCSNGRTRHGFKTRDYIYVKHINSLSMNDKYTVARTLTLRGYELKQNNNGAYIDIYNVTAPLSVIFTSS